MQRLKVYPYQMYSKSARSLARALGVLKVHPAAGYRGGRRYNGDLVINWGCSERPNWLQRLRNRGGRMLNSCEAVDIARNKLRAFEAMEAGDVRTVPFTTSRAEADAWLDAGSTVVARNKLEAHSGQGITVFKPDGEENALIDAPLAPLYSKYVKKTFEMRVHVVDGRVIDFAQKKRAMRVDADDVNWEIRNHQHGWIFAREGVEMPDDVRDQALAAIKAIGLDFGSVDVIWNQHQGKAFILEINTATGIEGTTLERYVAAFRSMRRC